MIVVSVFTKKGSESSHLIPFVQCALFSVMISDPLLRNGRKPTEKTTGKTTEQRENNRLAPPSTLPSLWVHASFLHLGGLNFQIQVGPWRGIWGTLLGSLNLNLKSQMYLPWILRFGVLDLIFVSTKVGSKKAFNSDFVLPKFV